MAIKEKNLAFTINPRWLNPRYDDPESIHIATERLVTMDRDGTLPQIQDVAELPPVAGCGTSNLDLWMDMLGLNGRHLRDTFKGGSWAERRRARDNTIARTKEPLK